MNRSIHFVDTVTSTNDFLKSIGGGYSPDWALIAVARYQTQGRGQRGTHWSSPPGENLLFSGYFPLPELNAGRQFDISRKVSLVLVRFLEDQGVDGVRIKWPNDILVRNRKIAGILIENSLRGGILSRALIGVGLNVNQSDFGGLPAATSMKLVLGHQSDPRRLGALLADYLIGKFSDVNLWTQDDREEYRQRLYGLGQMVKLSRTVEGEPIQNFRGVIEGVTSDGRLMQRLESGKLQYYLTKEVSWHY